MVTLFTPFKPTETGKYLLKDQGGQPTTVFVQKDFDTKKLYVVLEGVELMLDELPNHLLWASVKPNCFVSSYEVE